MSLVKKLAVSASNVALVNSTQRNVRGLVGLLVLLLVVGCVCFLCAADEVRKGVELHFRVGGIRFEVAESIVQKGAGNRMAAVAAIAQGASDAMNHQISTPGDNTDDDQPERDANLDPHTSLRLNAGELCRVVGNGFGTKDERLTVLGFDGDRVLIEYRDKGRYRGPRRGAGSTPVIEDGSLRWNNNDESPKCLDKAKLGVTKDVLLALLNYQPPPGKFSKKGTDTPESKAAVKRAMGKRSER